MRSVTVRNHGSDCSDCSHVTAVKWCKSESNFAGTTPWTELLCYVFTLQYRRNGSRKYRGIGRLTALFVKSNANIKAQCSLLGAGVNLVTGHPQTCRSDISEVPDTWRAREGLQDVHRFKLPALSVLHPLLECPILPEDKKAMLSLNLPPISENVQTLHILKAVGDSIREIVRSTKLT